MTNTIILTEIDDRGVATVTLNRPDVHNAFNEHVIAELDKTFKSLGQNEKVRVIIITGAGKSFSAGADLNWMKAAAGFSEAENIADANDLSSMLSTLNFCPKPTIALINGAAFGGGVGLVSCCDIAIAVENAKFSLSEVKLGLTPATISPYVIAAIGERAARRYFLTAERFNGVEAKRIGLVHETTSTMEDAKTTVSNLIDTMLANAPIAQTEAKNLVFAVAGKEITNDLRADTARRIAERRASAEAKEGLSAFLEKRRPNWSAE
jgi:methylglutaconyl-CoA hydratase